MTTPFFNRADSHGDNRGVSAGGNPTDCSKRRTQIAISAPAGKWCLDELHASPAACWAQVCRNEQSPGLPSILRAPIRTSTATAGGRCKKDTPAQSCVVSDLSLWRGFSFATSRNRGCKIMATCRRASYLKRGAVDNDFWSRFVRGGRPAKATAERRGQSVRAGVSAPPMSVFLNIKGSRSAPAYPRCVPIRSPTRLANHPALLKLALALETLDVGRAPMGGRRVHYGKFTYAPVGNFSPLDVRRTRHRFPAG